MYLKIVFGFLMSASLLIAQGKPANMGIDKAAFYAVMETGSIDEIDAQLVIIKKTTFAEKLAYEGALLMKKAGMMAKPKDKINFFKSGRTKLEAAIAAEKDNVEYRFLRLIMQEHAPKIVKYRNELEEDSKLIKTNFNKLSAQLQQLITDYSKKSKVLKTP